MNNNANDDDVPAVYIDNMEGEENEDETMKKKKKSKLKGMFKAVIGKKDKDKDKKKQNSLIEDDDAAHFGRAGTMIEQPRQQNSSQQNSSIRQVRSGTVMYDNQNDLMNQGQQDPRSMSTIQPFNNAEEQNDNEDENGDFYEQLDKVNDLNRGESKTMHQQKRSGSTMVKSSKQTEKPQDLNQSEVMVEQKNWQKKSYCQICFSKFTSRLRQHHCRMCGRSCCYQCCSQRPVKDIEKAMAETAQDVDENGQLDLSTSVLSNDGDMLASSQHAKLDATDGLDKKSKGVTTRVCEYCEVKLDNAQLHGFYEMGKSWRDRENDLVVQKREWYQGAVADIAGRIDAEQREMAHADTAHRTKQNQVNIKIDNITEDRDRIESIKRDIENDTTRKIIDSQSIDDRVVDMGNQRSQLMIELDKVIEQFEHAERQKQELIDKMQMLNGVQPDTSMDLYQSQIIQDTPKLLDTPQGYNNKRGRSPQAPGMPSVVIEPMIVPADADSQNSRSVQSENPYEEIMDPEDPYNTKSMVNNHSVKPNDGYAYQNKHQFYQQRAYH